MIVYARVSHGAWQVRAPAYSSCVCDFAVLARRSLGSMWSKACSWCLVSNGCAYGPYRFFAHPDYLGRIGEILAFTLLCGSYITLAAYFGLMLWILPPVLIHERRKWRFLLVRIFRGLRLFKKKLWAGLGIPCYLSPPTRYTKRKRMYDFNVFMGTALAQAAGKQPSFLETFVIPMGGLLVIMYFWSSDLSKKKARECSHVVKCT